MAELTRAGFEAIRWALVESCGIRPSEIRFDADEVIAFTTADAAQRAASDDPPPPEPDVLLYIRARQYVEADELRALVD